jgi:hypothetical protein
MMKRFFYFAVIAGIFWGVGFGQEAVNHKVLVEYYVLGLPSTEMTIILRDTQAYVPLRKTFDYIGIKGDFNPAKMQLQGFLKNPDTSYVVDFQKGNASIRNRKLTVTPFDYILEADTLYLRTGFLNDLFGLDFKYSPRRVRIELKRTRGLPSLLALARRRRYEMLAQRQANIPASEYYLGREAAAIGAGRFDWTTSTLFTPSRFLGTRYSLGLGLQALGGDFTGSDVGFIDHGTNNTNQLRGQYRLPFLDNYTLQQIIIGDYVSSSVQPRLMRGFELTNRPLAQRFSFSREVFHGQFDPQIDVDLTGTSILPRYQQTDNQGMYQFDVPVLYGQGVVEIRAYDPWGRVELLRYRMNVSHNLVPPGQIEYSIAGGKTRPPIDMYSSSNYINWGVSSDLTMGMKLEYYDITNAHQKFFPAFTATSRLFNNIILNGSVSPQALSQANLSWLFFTAADLEATGTQYAKNNFFNPGGITNDINATLSLPFDIQGYSSGIGAFADQTLYNGYMTQEIQGSFSMTFQSFAPRISTVLAWRNDIGQSATATRRSYDASIAFFLPAGVIFQPEISYNQLDDQVESIIATLAKSIGTDFRIFGTYDRLPQFNSYSFGLNLAYFFPFFRVQAGATTTNGGNLQYSTLEAGSIGFDPRNGTVYFENSPNFVGFGGVVVHPFFDANNNGVFDPGEESIDKAHVYYSNINRETPFISLTVNRLSVDRLPQYEDFDIFLDPQSLDNPVWVPRNPSFRMLSEPNRIRTVEMPVVTGGTIRGTVYIVQDNLKRTAEEIKISIVSVTRNGAAEKTVVKKGSTFSTGEFEFSPLPPGKYRVELDATQLESLGLTSQTMGIEVELAAKAEGDVVGNVDFTLIPK